LEFLLLVHKLYYAANLAYSAVSAISLMFLSRRCLDILMNQQAIILVYFPMAKKMSHRYVHMRNREVCANPKVAKQNSLRSQKSVVLSRNGFCL